MEHLFQRSIRIILFLCFISFLHLPPLLAQKNQNWTWGGPIDPLQKRVTILHYGLDLEIHPDSQQISGSVTVSFEAKEPLDTLRLQLIDTYEVNNVEYPEGTLPFLHFGDTLDIYLHEKQATEITVYYSGQTPIAKNPPWSGGFTWKKDTLGNHWMGLSSQNEGTKIFMPSLDHPSSKPSQGVTLAITVPVPYFVAANGQLIQKQKKEDKITYQWSTHYPIHNYNINFTLGAFHKEEKNYTSISGRQIPMHVYVLEENRLKAPLLLDVLENSVRTHESYFGEFPFPEDKIAVVETPYLGMEHQTINGYGNNFQFVRMGGVFYDWLLHHELGHEWWGNKVSVRDWADFWIHEGLTTYGDWLFYRSHESEEAYRKKIADIRKTIKNDQPVVGPPDSLSGESYHTDIYNKGAFILHSLRYILGDGVFFPMLMDFLKEENFTYQNQVTTKDFTNYVIEYSGQDLEAFFQLYLYSTDIPRLKVSKKGKDNYLVSLTNIDFDLPVDVQTDKGVERYLLSSKPVSIKSHLPVQVDPLGWYLIDH